MLIDLAKAIASHNLSIRGVIHAGAHYGQEYSAYRAAGINHIAFIEPCKVQFAVLKEKFEAAAGVHLFKCALGDKPGIAEMNVEQRNEGQSNSLLQPKDHLRHYPDITFTKKEKVKVCTLDELNLERSNYNLLMMDVQGYEKYVVAGGKETLKGIDIVYSEVNKKELYEGCTMIGELDALLSDFERVETTWCGNHGWGDAIYIRKQNVIRVPAEFRTRIRNTYPADNVQIFEEWFARYFVPKEANRTYLPVMWTSYYVNNKFGRDRAAIARLQVFLNRLDRSKKYFTIVQYDDGILNKISDLDIRV